MKSNGVDLQTSYHATQDTEHTDKAGKARAALQGIMISIESSVGLIQCSCCLTSKRLLLNQCLLLLMVQTKISMHYNANQCGRTYVAKVASKDTNGRLISTIFMQRSRSFPRRTHFSSARRFSESCLSVGPSQASNFRVRRICTADDSNIISGLYNKHRRKKSRGHVHTFCDDLYTLVRLWINKTHPQYLTKFSEGEEDIRILAFCIFLR